MNTLTVVHVVISLIGIATGFVVAAALVAGRRFPVWTASFLASTVLTSVTGFFFPFEGFTPAFGFGVVSLLVLGPIIYGLYVRQLAGAWRWLFPLGAIFAFYLNFFVLIVQSFINIPGLHALAPTQSEPPFAIAQGLAFLAFALIGFLAVRRSRPPAPVLPAVSSA